MKQVSDPARDATAPAETGAAADPDARFEARVLRAFVKNGRLVSIPAQQKKRAVVLRFLVDRCFESDRSYPEREVNELLAEWHADVAALRRYMVTAGLLTRAGGEYRRA
jgi:hypothetical protein